MIAASGCASSVGIQALARSAAAVLVQAGQYLAPQQAARLSTIPDPDMQELYSLRQEQQAQSCAPCINHPIGQYVPESNFEAAGEFRHIP